MTSKDATQSMGGYLFWYALTFTGFSVIIGLALYILNMSGNSGASIGATMASAIFVSQRFHKATGRLMNRSERLTAIFGSLVISFLVSALLIISVFLVLAGGFGGLLTMLNQLFQSMPVSMWLLAGAIGLAIQGAVLWFSYGYLARVIVARQNKRP